MHISCPHQIGCAVCIICVVAIHLSDVNVTFPGVTDGNSTDNSFDIGVGGRMLAIDHGAWHTSCTYSKCTAGCA